MASPNSFHTWIFSTHDHPIRRFLGLLVAVHCLRSPTSQPCCVDLPLLGLTPRLAPGTLVPLGATSGMRLKLCCRWELMGILTRSSARHSLQMLTIYLSLSVLSSVLPHYMVYNDRKLGGGLAVYVIDK